MRQLVTVFLLLFVILVPAYWFYTHYITPSKVDDLLKVDFVAGEAVISAEGGERALRLQELISGGQHLRTGDGGTVRLSMGEGGVVELAANSELDVGQIGEDGVSFELKSGQLEARVKHFYRKSVTVGFEGSASRVRMIDGAATMVTDGRGGFSVGVSEGTDVSLVHGDQTAEPIPAGEHRAVGSDGVVVSSGTIPRSVLLKVDWPTELQLNAAELEVKGEVAPGSKVTVDGKGVETDGKGHFSTRLTLEEGAQRVKVEATGLGDKTVIESPELTVDTRPPRLETNTETLWK